MISEIVGDYRILSYHAAGSLGEVYVGEHHLLGTRAAVEIIHPQLAVDAAAVQVLLATLRRVAMTNHHGAMKLLGAGVDPAGRSYVISELLDGETLAKRIETSGRLSVTQIGEIGRQLATVLAAAHDEGIVHGALRPGAIFLVRPTGHARTEPIKVTEFGIAALKRTVGIPINPLYMAPELLRGAAPDWRADAYAFGCIAFEMATGRPPFSGATADELRAKHLEQIAPAARSHMPDVTPALDILIGRLLSKHPEDRYSSMRELGRAFEGIGGGAVRALAATAHDQPAVMLGEVMAKGEIITSGVIQAPTHEPTRVAEPPAAPAAKRGSKLLWLIAIAVVAIGAAIAVVLATRS